MCKALDFYYFYQILKFTSMKISRIKPLANVALWVVIIGGIVFALGFGISLHLVKEEVQKWSDRQADLAIANISSYVDGQLCGVEDVAYTFSGANLGYSARPDDGVGIAELDPAVFGNPTEDDMFVKLENFLDANPQICGIAVGFEPGVSRWKEGPYGAACYVTNVSGSCERLRLGEINDYRNKEWYSQAFATGEPYWSRPFRETSRGKVVTCFSLPIKDKSYSTIGVLALDIDTEAFRIKCIETAPFPGAEICLIDRENRFISHSDVSLILTSAADVERYAPVCSEDISQERNKTIEDGSDIFYLARIDRNGWKVCAEFDKEAVYGSVNRMRQMTRAIALLSLIIMGLCFAWLFRRLQKTTLKQANIESELNVASNIQMGMLKSPNPELEATRNVDIHAFMRPAKVVGGDLYDYCLVEGKLYFCIGDVSGKGVPASLFMTEVLALFRNQTLNSTTAAKIVTSMNETLTVGNDTSMFCTMFVGVLDLESGVLDWCSAGHNAPIVGGQFLKSTPQLPLATFPGIHYCGNETVLKPGEFILLYTDGVSESENGSKSLFGDERLLASAAREAAKEGQTSYGYVSGIMQDIKAHAGTAEQNDDITMLVIKYD